MLADMTLFHALVLLHVVTGAVGLTAFWGPIVTKKGSLRHRKWGRAACYGFLGAGALAIAMSFLSLWGPEHRHPEIADRELFDGLFGWMMLYLGTLTIGFVDYGLAVVRHSRKRKALRLFRYQAMIAAVIVTGAWCGIYGYRVGHPLMMLVASIGIAAMLIQQRYIWRAADFRKAPMLGTLPRAYRHGHFGLHGLPVCRADPARARACLQSRHLGRAQRHRRGPDHRVHPSDEESRREGPHVRCAPTSAASWRWSCLASTIRPIAR